MLVFIKVCVIFVLGMIIRWFFLLWGFLKIIYFLWFFGVEVIGRLIDFGFRFFELELYFVLGGKKFGFLDILLYNGIFGILVCDWEKDLKYFW